MMDFTIFRSPVFMCFCFHSMLLYVSYDIPYVYLPDLAKDLDISTTRASFLLSIAGIASTVGQVKHFFLGLWISSSVIITFILVQVVQIRFFYIDSNYVVIFFFLDFYRSISYFQISYSMFDLKRGIIRYITASIAIASYYSLKYI